MRRDERFSCVIARDESGKVTGMEVAVEHLDRSDRRRVSLNGDRASFVVGTLHDLLRAGGVGGRQWTSSHPIPLDQTTGAHAWLLLGAIKPLRRADRLDEVARGVAAMSREEASYWYAKSRRPRGLPAMRLLLSNDERGR